MHYLPCNGNLVGKTSQKLNTDRIPLDIRTRFFFQNNCLDFFRQDLNQLFLLCTKTFNLHFFFEPFLENLIPLTCQKICKPMILLCIRTATGWSSSSRRQSTSTMFLIALKQKLWRFNALSRNLVGWELQNLHMHVIVLEISTHLSPKLATELLPPKPQWTFLIMYKLTR